MRLWFGLVAIILATSPAIAQSLNTYYWCDETRGWYPNVRTCPVPWREVVVKPQERLRPPAQLLPQSEAETTLNNPLTRTEFPQPSRLGDGLDDWCAQVKLPRSVALCSDA